MRSTTRIFPTTQAVAGRVVDEAGWPIVGAVVIQYGKSGGYGYSEWDLPDKEFETNNRAVTDVLGKFEFKTYNFDHGNDSRRLEMTLQKTRDILKTFGRRRGIARCAARAPTQFQR